MVLLMEHSQSIFHTIDKVSFIKIYIFCLSFVVMLFEVMQIIIITTFNGDFTRVYNYDACDIFLLTPYARFYNSYVFQI